MKLEDAVMFVGGDYGPSTGDLVSIIIRVILNFATGIACWVPMRLLYRNGELAGTALVVALAIYNFFHAINTLIWPNNDIASWYKGYGWCDIQLVTWVPLETLNSAAVCAIMHNIAKQVSLMRVTGLTGNEKRRKHLIQALIVFPVPILQAVLYYFIIARRYNISGIVGCEAIFDPNWVFLVFFLLPCPTFAIIAAYFAALTWWRYRQIDATSREALWKGSNSSAQARSARTRRKLYFMTLTIIAPYLPMQLAFLYSNINMGMPWSKPYNLSRIHAPGWDQIDYAPSTIVPFTNMNTNYIAVIEVVIVYVYFGRTKEAHDMYRRYLRAIGLSKIFPKLNEEWFPSDRPPASLSSLWSRAKNISTFVSSTQTSSSSASKNRTRAAVRQLSDVDDTQPFSIRLNSLDLEAARSTTTAAQSSDEECRLPLRHPWVFRTTLAPHLPKVMTPNIFSKKKQYDMRKPASESSLKSAIHQLHTSRARSPMRHHDGSPSDANARMTWTPSPNEPAVQTRVWASNTYRASLEEDANLRKAGSETGVVRIERHISSSSEISPPQPAFNFDFK